MFNTFSRFEQAFAHWRRGGYPGVKPAMHKCIELVTAPADAQRHQRRYVPDFLVEYVDGRRAVIEVKDPSRTDSPDVLRKRKAAEMWCRQRGMEYLIATVPQGV